MPKLCGYDKKKDMKFYCKILLTNETYIKTFFLNHIFQYKPTFFS